MYDHFVLNSQKPQITNEIRQMNTNEQIIIQLWPKMVNTQED